MKKILCALCLAGLGVSALAAPTISNVTIWPDTSFSGPYVVSAVITDPVYALAETLIAYDYNLEPGASPYGFSFFSRPDSVRGDTSFFSIGAIPPGYETPVRVCYAIYAANELWEEALSPATGHHAFLNTIYSPHYSNVAGLRDTFHSGPLVVKANITTAYGDSVANDFLYTDLLGGDQYYRDSVGADGCYYYSVPRLSGGAQTPITALWFLGSQDTLGNLGSYPLKRDTLNRFIFIDPMPSNVRTLANTGDLGPFPVWVDYKTEGAVANDSLWLFDGADFQPYPRDSIGTANPARHFYTIPAQAPPVVDPRGVTWYLKASDDASGNFTYLPASAPWPSYAFYVYDRTPPVVEGLTLLANATLPGTQTVYADAHDTSGIFQIRLYYRMRPNADTAWQFLPMYATATPNRYKATLPFIPAGALVQYYVSAVDGARDENAVLLRNTAYQPAGGPLTPWHFTVGDHPYRLLLVGDQLPSNNYQGAYLSSLDTTGVTYGYWDNRRAPVLPQLGNFDKLIWFTGDDSLNTLTQEDRDSLAAFLDRGGNLLLCSKNLGQNIGDTSVFFSDYLKAQFYSNRSTQMILVGRDAYPISYGPVDSAVISGATQMTASMDVVTPLPGADSVFTFRTIGRCGVIRCSTATFRTVFATIPLEGLTRNTNGRISRTHFIARCLRWFGMTVFYKVDGEPQAAAPGPDLKLLPASPNPFRSATVVRYQTPQGGRVSLKVYNVAGQVVRTLVDGVIPAGRHSATWDGKDENGSAASNGIYFYRLRAGGEEMVGKAALIR